MLFTQNYPYSSSQSFEQLAIIRRIRSENSEKINVFKSFAAAPAQGI